MPRDRDKLFAPPDLFTFDDLLLTVDCRLYMFIYLFISNQR